MLITKLDKANACAAAHYRVKPNAAVLQVVNECATELATNFTAPARTILAVYAVRLGLTIPELQHLLARKDVK